MTLSESDGKPPIYAQVEHLTNEIEKLKKQFIPLEPLLDLDIASRLIPLEYDRLQQFLRTRKHQFPAVYRMTRQRHRRRVLSASEIKKIRSMVLRGPGLFKVT